MLILFILLPKISNTQKIIYNDFYLYGELDGIIKGKILVSYKVKDPETGNIVMIWFEKLWFSNFYARLFFPQI